MLVRSLVLFALCGLVLDAHLARADTGGTAPADLGVPDSVERELRSVQQELEALKSTLVHHKTKLDDIKLAGASSPTVERGSAQVDIVFQNQISQRFVPVRYVGTLDGVEIFNPPASSGELTKPKTQVFAGRIAAGGHTLVMRAEFRGSAVGAFAYMKKVRVTLSATHVFHASDDKPVQVRVVGLERGSPSTPPDQRLSIVIEEPGAVIK